jgi:hypothetical protein
MLKAITDYGGISLTTVPEKFVSLNTRTTPEQRFLGVRESEHSMVPTSRNIAIMNYKCEVSISPQRYGKHIKGVAQESCCLTIR